MNLLHEAVQDLRCRSGARQRSLHALGGHGQLIQANANGVVNGVRNHGAHADHGRLATTLRRLVLRGHDDRLDFGLLTCPVAVPDPQHLADLLERALQTLEKELLKLPDGGE